MKKLTSFIVVALFIVGMVSVSMLPGSQESEEAVFLATSTKIISTTPTKWFSCAAPALDNEWYYKPGYTTISCNGVNYVGNFGTGGSISSPALTVGAHQGILVSLNLMLLDTWEGESFKVKADGKEVYSQAHTHPVSGINNCGLMGPDSLDMYETITFGFNHTASALSLVFTSTISQDKSVKSWGICDLTITASATPVQANGRPMPTLSETPQTWFNCVDGRIDVAWTYNPQHMYAYCNGMYYIGNYGTNHYVRSPAYPVAPHKGIIVSLNLMLLDSWEGEYFIVKADEFQVYSLQWSFGQATSNTCGQGWNDAYKTITFGFNHTASTVSFLLTSTLNQDRMDESWGVCDFTVRTTQHRVNADGQIVPDLSENPVTFMPCTTAAQEINWSYTPGYTTISCNNLKYTGNYGAREYIISPALTLAPHQGIIVSLNLMLLDSWDGESFFVKADDQVVYSYRWIEQKATSNTCGYRWKDAYPSVTFGFNHTASTVTFVLSSTLDQDKTDESWGVCGFTVIATPYQVTYEGKPKTN